MEMNIEAINTNPDVQPPEIYCAYNGGRMSKYPIKWHKECYKHHQDSHAKMETELTLLEEMVRKSRRGLDHYSMQINKAIAENKDGFDRDKYMKVKNV